MSYYIQKFRSFLRKNETARGLFLVGIVILGAIAVWGGIRLALNTEYPVLVVSSPSMCPPANCVLPVGALVVIRGASPSTIGIGQIIVFRRDPASDFLIIHRVVGVVPPNQSTYGEYSFRTKGDANTGEDRWTPSGYVPGSWVVGVYQFTIPIPYLGSIILWIRDFMYDPNSGQVRPQGLLIIVALVIALFAFEVVEPGKKQTPKNPDIETLTPNTEPASQEETGLGG